MPPVEISSPFESFNNVKYSLATPVLVGRVDFVQLLLSLQQSRLKKCMLEFDVVFVP